MENDRLLNENDLLLKQLYLQQYLRIGDMYALQLMQPLFNEYYLPFTNYTLRPFCLLYILNDIMINNRRAILEFGAGISTIMTGRLLKRNCPGAKIISIEHDDEWYVIMQDMIRKEQLGEVITLVHAPLRPCSLAVGKNLWYDMELVRSSMGDMMFDMVIVDGPPAWEDSKKEARYPALPFVYKSLAARYAVYLDDADREGEMSVLRKWEEEFPVDFFIKNKSLAGTTRGQYFNPEFTK